MEEGARREQQVEFHWSAVSENKKGRKGMGKHGRRNRENFAVGYEERLQAWRCPLCLHDSVDPRRVCGFCLEVEPGVVQCDPHPRKDGKNDAFVYACPSPGVSEDPEVSVLLLPHGRCYRSVSNNNTATSDEYCEKKVESSSGNGGQQKRAVYTHFVSIPIGRLSSVQPNATVLLEEMKRRCVDPAAMVSDDIFTTAPRMHITLLMLSLPTEEAVGLAKECMQLLAEKVSAWKKTSNAARKAGRNNSDDCGSLKIKLGGLHVMKSRGRDEKQADVLYMGLADAASVDVVEMLQQFVCESFAELTVNDPSVRETGKLLHMTLLNSKWRAVEGMKDNAAEAKFHQRVPFNATRILEEFGDAVLCGGEADSAIALECIELNALKFDVKLECYTTEIFIPV